MRIQYENVNPTKLHDELLANGVTPLLLENDCLEGDYIASYTWITFSDDVDITLIQSIVEKHNPTPLILKQSIELINRADIDYIAIMTGVDLNV